MISCKSSMAAASSFKAVIFFARVFDLSTSGVKLADASRLASTSNFNLLASDSPVPYFLVQTERTIFSLLSKSNNWLFKSKVSLPIFSAASMSPLNRSFSYVSVDSSSSIKSWSSFSIPFL